MDDVLDFGAASGSERPYIDLSFFPRTLATARGAEIQDTTHR